MSQESSASRPDWFPEKLQAWILEHPGVLDEIYAAFEATGSWPDPVPLDRELRHRGHHLRLVSTVDQMPQELGSRDWSPSRVRLSLFAFACVPRASTLLADYFATLRYTLSRYDDPTKPGRITRDEVVAELGLSDDRAHRVSCVLTTDAPFLASGNPDPNAWDLEIDPRITDFEDAETPIEFLRILADQRGLLREPSARIIEAEQTGEHLQPDPPKAPESIGAATAIGAVLALGANVAALLVVPLPIGLGVAAASLAAGITHRSLLRPRPAIASVALVVTTGLAAGLLTLELEDDEQPATRHFYRVDIEETNLIRAHEKPSNTARETVFGPLGGGDVVEIACVEDGQDGSGPWGRLLDGTYVPMAYLAPAGRPNASDPPRC